MTFLESVKRCMSTKYASMKGRAPLSEFCWYMLYRIGCYSIIILLIVLPKTFPIGVVIGSIYKSAHILPTISVIVRRLHDSDRSGSFVWLFLLGPIGLLLLLIFLLRSSSAGVNKYGAPYPYNDERYQLNTSNFTYYKTLLNKAWNDKYGIDYPDYSLLYIPEEHYKLLEEWYIEQEISNNKKKNIEIGTFCPYCGAEVKEENIEYCWKCGKHISK